MRPPIAYRIKLILFRAGFASALAAGLLASGCEDRTPPQAPASRVAAPPIKPPSAIYVTRGVVRQLPIPGEPQTEFQVEHEAIDNFKNQSGLVVGMNTMIMPFPLGPGVTLEGLVVGDIVELTFAIWWDETAPEYHVTRLTKLPANTALQFRAARPALEEETQPAKRAPGLGDPSAVPTLPVPGTRP